jgi:ATP/maltotriose-dependent transcriptional regulator MalT
MPAPRQTPHVAPHAIALRAPPVTPVPGAMEELVVRTRFLPPTLRPHIIARPRVEALLARAMDFPLTVVKAEPGYGKTTAVASWLAGSGLAHVWYNVGETEADPNVFLLHLVQALRTISDQIGGRALELLEKGVRAPRLWDSTVDALSNDLLDCLTTKTVLVLDDYDRVNSSEVNAIIGRLVETMPPLLHLVLTARRMPSFRGRARWRASGEMLEVTRPELAFTTDEVALLLDRRLAQPASSEVARAVAAETEGWPIALQMLSDSLGASHAEALDSLLQRIPGPSELLFDYLAEEVFLRQSPEVRTFLGESALLRRLDADTCDHVLGARDSAEVLRLLEHSSLFVTADGSFRYHNLFRDFLRRRSGVSAERKTELHRLAAEYFRGRGEDEEAVYHLLAAGDHAGAAEALARIAAPMAEGGRHQTFRTLLDQLPEAVLAASPDLLLARAETSRISCRYAEALPAYIDARRQFRTRGDAAGELRALRGQALLYLDTVQPARAEPLLREALLLTRGDPAARRGVYLLLAENRLNSGETRHAERLFRAVHRAMGGDMPLVLNPRVYVRQGRFAEARQVVEASVRSEPAAGAKARAPRSHREASALLAWTEMMAGDAGDARQHAAESIEIGHLLGSPVVECIALSRHGLAWLAGHDYDTARALAYLTDALRVADRIGVARFRAEPLLGMTIAHGIDGDPERAERAGREGLSIVEQTGDRYLRAILCSALGAAMVLCSRPSAEEWLVEAIRESLACGDQFTSCVAALWLAVHASRSGQPAAARQSFARVLESAQRHGYDFLFDGTALLAPKDVSMMRGLLRRAQEQSGDADYARALSGRLDPGESASSAGATESLATAELYVQTLGPFRVWRRGQEIERSAWGREKALHLLQLFVCSRKRPLHRDEILEALWSESAASTATTGLRVALTALRNALEPERTAGVESPFIRRDGDTIGLALEGGVRVDADEFSRLLKVARAQESVDVEQSITRYEGALALYRGEFLGENRYAGWAETERQDCRREFLESAERLAGLLLRTGEHERAARWAETMLQHDPLWEAGYTLLMEGYWRQGNRALAVRTYNRCRKRLKDALGVAPSTRTMALLERITQNR